MKSNLGRKSPQNQSEFSTNLWSESLSLCIKLNLNYPLIHLKMFLLLSSTLADRSSNWITNKLMANKKANEKRKPGKKKKFALDCPGWGRTRMSTRRYLRTLLCFALPDRPELCSSHRTSPECWPSSNARSILVKKKWIETYLIVSCLIQKWIFLPIVNESLPKLV